MEAVSFPTINLVKTGKNIERLRKERGISVRELQAYFGFEQPQAIYKWQWGRSLPSVDNLFALGKILHVPMQEILVENDQDLVLLKLEKCNRASSDKEICVWPPYGKTFIHMIKCVYKKLKRDSILSQNEKSFGVRVIRQIVKEGKEVHDLGSKFCIICGLYCSRNSSFFGQKKRKE